MKCLFQLVCLRIADDLLNRRGTDLVLLFPACAKKKRTSGQLFVLIYFNVAVLPAKSVTFIKNGYLYFSKITQMKRFF